MGAIASITQIHQCSLEKIKLYKTCFPFLIKVNKTVWNNQAICNNSFQKSQLKINRISFKKLFIEIIFIDI